MLTTETIYNYSLNFITYITIFRNLKIDNCLFSYLFKKIKFTHTQQSLFIKKKQYKFQIKRKGTI